MRRSLRLRAHAALGVLMLGAGLGLAGQAAAAYHPITPTMAEKTRPAAR